MQDARAGIQITLYVGGRVVAHDEAIRSGIPAQKNVLGHGPARPPEPELARNAELAIILGPLRRQPARKTA